MGIIAGILAAIYPFLFVYDGWLYSESIYIFLLLTFCYTLYRFQRTARQRWSVGSGVLLGLLSLTRPNGLFILALVILWAIIMGVEESAFMASSGSRRITIALLSLAFVAPWTVRNYTVTHTRVPIATGDGKILLGAYNDRIADPSFQHGY